MNCLNLSLTEAAADELDALVELRIQAMRPSLERIGRFDARRARERFSSGFVPRHTRHIEVDATRVGFVVVKPDGDTWLLDHLYVQPGQQSRGVGSAVLARVFAEADAAGKDLRVGALRGSDANRFYQRHGFVQTSEEEWDIYYLRRCAASAAPSAPSAPSASGEASNAPDTA